MQDFSSVASCCKKKNPVDVDVERQVVEHVYRWGFTWGAASFEGLPYAVHVVKIAVLQWFQNTDLTDSHLSGTSTKSESKT